MSTIPQITVKMLMGEINGILGDYTQHGWMIDYGARSARAVIIDTDKIGEELRKLRIGDNVKLRLTINYKVEYEGSAEVQMVRFRASRKELPHFRTQFKLKDMQ